MSYVLVQYPPFTSPHPLPNRHTFRDYLALAVQKTTPKLSGLKQYSFYLSHNSPGWLGWLVWLFWCVLAWLRLEVEEGSLPCLTIGLMDPLLSWLISALCVFSFSSNLSFFTQRSQNSKEEQERISLKAGFSSIFLNLIVNAHWLKQVGQPSSE